MSLFNLAMEASLRSISPVTMAGSVSMGAGTPRSAASPLDSRPGGWGGSRRVRGWSVARPRSRGSPLPRTSKRPARLAGDAKPKATSTNSLPPATYIGRGVVSCQKESPRGFMASVIICA